MILLSRRFIRLFPNVHLAVPLRTPVRRYPIIPQARLFFNDSPSSSLSAPVQIGLSRQNSPPDEPGGFARRKSKLCCIIASQVCLGERVAFSRHGSAKPPTGTQSVPARGPLLLHALIQIGLSRQNSPPDEPGGFTCRKSKSLYCGMALPSRLRERRRSRAGLCSCTRPYKSACPAKTAPRTSRGASRAGSQSLCAAAWLRQAAYENAGRSRTGLCSCTRPYKSACPAKTAPRTSRGASRAGSQSLCAAAWLRQAAYENAGRSRTGLCSCTRPYKSACPAKTAPRTSRGAVLAGIAGLEPARAGVKVLCLNRLGYIPL